MADGILETGAGRGSIDQYAASVDRLRRDKGVLRPPESTRVCQFFIFLPQPLQQRCELISHFVTQIVLVGRQAEHLELALLVSGNDIEAPTSVTHIVYGGAKLRQMQWVPAIEDMDSRDKKDLLCERRKTRGYQERI